MSAGFPRLSEHHRFKPHCTAPYAVEDNHHELGDEKEEEVPASPDEEYPSTDSASLSTPKSANGIDGDGAKRPRLDLTETAASRQVYDEFGEASDIDGCEQRLESDSMPTVASDEIDVSAGKLTLWQFLLELLQSNKYRHIIQWTSRKGEFILIQAEVVAKLWGMRKDRNHRMNYDKLSRALRYYYQKNILRKVHGHKFVYQFMGLDNCTEVAQKDYTKCSSTDGCAPILSGSELSQASTEVSSRPTHETDQRKRGIKQSASQNLLPLPFDSDSSLGRSLDPSTSNLFASRTDERDASKNGVGVHQHPGECAANFSGPFKTSSSPMITDINSFLSSLDCLTSAFQSTFKAPLSSRYKQTDKEIRELTNSSCSDIWRESNSMPCESREVQQPPFLLPTKPAVNDPVSQLTNPYLLLANLYRSCEEFAHSREQETSTSTSADSLASRKPANTAFKPIQPGDKSRAPRPVSPNCSCSCHLTSHPLTCSPVNSINQYTDRAWPGSKLNPVSPLQTDKVKAFTASPQTVTSAYLCKDDSPVYSSQQLHHERHTINMRRLGEQLTRLHHHAVASPPLSTTRSASPHPAVVQPCYDRPGGLTSRPMQHFVDSLKSQQRPQQEKQQSPTFTTDGQCIWMPVPVDLLQTWFHFLASSPALHATSPGSTPPVSSFQSQADPSAEVSSTNPGLRSANGSMSPAAPVVVVSPREMKREYSVH